MVVNVLGLSPDQGDFVVLFGNTWGKCLSLQVLRITCVNEAIPITLWGNLREYQGETCNGLLYHAGGSSTVGARWQCNCDLFS